MDVICSTIPGSCCLDSIGIIFPNCEFVYIESRKIGKEHDVNMVSIIIVAAIVLYAAFVIRKKVKDMKAGKFCSCGCSDCPSAKKCHSK